MKKLIAISALLIMQVAHGVGIQPINNKEDAMRSIISANTSVHGAGNLLISVGLPTDRGYQDKDQLWASLLDQMKEYVKKDNEWTTQLQMLTKKGPSEFPALQPYFHRLQTISWFAFNIMTGIYERDISPAVIERKRSSGVSDIDAMTGLSFLDPKNIDFAALTEKIDLDKLGEHMYAIQAKIDLLKEESSFKQGVGSSYVQGIITDLNRIAADLNKNLKKTESSNPAPWYKFMQKDKADILKANHAQIIDLIRKKIHMTESLVILAEHIDTQILRIIKDFDRLKNAYDKNADVAPKG